MEQPKRSGSDLKGFSCVHCRQRKVKCDQRTPCLNCTKAKRQCSFVAPVRGKRKKTKPARETLHARLRRYEEMLKGYGAKLELGEDGDDSYSEVESAKTPETNASTVSKAVSPLCRHGSEEDKPQFIMKEGASRYFDSALWSNLSEDFQHPEVTNFTNDQVEDIDEGGLFLESELNIKVECLARFHLPLDMVCKLKEYFIDRVDPMLKILHLPTFWVALSNGLPQLDTLPKSLEALIFAFYLVSISSLKDHEARNLFGVPLATLLSRYRVATRQALINARFLSTSNLMTLQAFSIFTICVRNCYRCDTLYILSGVAIRIARKMGLHRDGTFLGLSPFETEMRRRLWWHLAHIDFRTADVMGTKPSPEIWGGDTQKPTNVEDSELHPDMTEIPPERNGITPISLTLIKCEIIESLCKCTTTQPTDLRWEMLYNSGISMAKKDSIIKEVEDHLEKKYMRYCDPSNSFHTFISIMMRSAVCKMRLFAHNLRQFAHLSAKASQKDHDIAFYNAMKLLEYANLVQGGHMGLDKFLWQLGTSYCWNTMLYLLIEVRSRKTGPEIDKAWQLIGVVFSRLPQVMEEFFGSVYVALGKWTLEVWDSYVEASKEEGLPEPVPPAYINSIREWQRTQTEVESKATKNNGGHARPATGNQYWAGDEKISYSDYLNSGSSELHDFSNLMSFETDPNQWIQWEQLVAEQSGFA